MDLDLWPETFDEAQNGTVNVSSAAYYRKMENALGGIFLFFYLLVYLLYYEYCDLLRTQAKPHGYSCRYAQRSNLTTIQHNTAAQYQVANV